MGLEDFVAEIRAQGILGVPPEHIVELPGRQGKFGTIRHELHPSVADKLGKAGLDRFFSHQTQAIDAAAEGLDLACVTGTNSGKSLCYMVPALEATSREPSAKVLMLFPTKALAQDQLGKMQSLAPTGTRCATYDGDTPTGQRSSIRKLAHIVLTNPDMLHLGILPSHELWAKFLKSLRLIVIDEMHLYRGVFGSHVASVLWRLLRLCEWHGAHPQIIACSATIGNPRSLFESLTGRSPTLIDDDGAAKGRRTFVFWNPPVVGDGDRLSANMATSWLLAGMAAQGIRTLAFSRARVSAELVLASARRSLRKSKLLDPGKVESYRAGYTPKERREIEQGLFRGDILGLSSTSAMELGVDVGGLDAVILNGFPGTVASFWQQAGRAGRGDRDGLAIFIPHDDPLEQFLCREPHRVMEAGSESATVNPDNPSILAGQIQCAAYERAIAPTELSERPGAGLEMAELLEVTGHLQRAAGRFFYPHHEAPAPQINIRGTGGPSITLVEGGTAMGEMELWRALRFAHPGAVYLHRESTHVVSELDIESRVARLEQKKVDYYTEADAQLNIDIVAESEALEWSGNRMLVGVLKVTDLVVGYRVKSMDGSQVEGYEELRLPPIDYETIGLRLEFDPFEEQDDVAGLHALEHALMAVAPLLAGCDRNDLGSGWYAVHPDTGLPELFIFDRVPGGVGLSPALAKDRHAWIQAALQLVTGCPCEEGCPACILSPRCEAKNMVLSKKRAVEMLRRLAR